MREPGAPLRVLLLTETYWPEFGGGERQARLLSQALCRRGFKVTVAARRSRAGLPGSEHEGDVRVLRLPPTGARRWLKWCLPLTALGHLMRRRGEYDIVLVSGFRLLGIAALLARALTGKPVLLKADSRGEMSGEYFRTGLAALGLELHSPPIRAALRLRNAVLRRTDAFVALSSQMLHELTANGVPEARVHLIGNGVDTALFRPASAAERRALRPRMDLPVDAPIVLYTGRLVAYKGLPVLLDAWHRLQRQGTRGLLVLVGEGGSDIHSCEPALRAYVNASGLDSAVRFAGRVEDVHEWLRAADVFAFPTEEEAFGLSLAEAMACGLACVTTAVGGLGDFVASEHNTLIVAPGDTDGLAAALDRLLGDERCRLALGRAARRTAVERFGVDAVADAYAALLERIAGAAAVTGATRP